MALYNLRKSGQDDPALRDAVEELGLQLQELIQDYVRENSSAFYDLQNQY